MCMMHNAECIVTLCLVVYEWNAVKYSKTLMLVAGACPTLSTEQQVLGNLVMEALTILLTETNSNAGRM